MADQISILGPLESGSIEFDGKTCIALRLSARPNDLWASDFQTSFASQVRRDFPTTAEFRQDTLLVAVPDAGAVAGLQHVILNALRQANQNAKDREQAAIEKQAGVERRLADIAAEVQKLKFK